ncbi:MAG: hypothetical protein LQ351_004330 [Letrouitia transgressa]|nr:MAG: hypothetical protein LQ351_004330 [Letrouitia transgressa]
MAVRGWILGSYVPESLWTAAEPSTAVVCACLPSLRPLFVRMLWGDQSQRTMSRLNRKLMTSSWWSGKSQDYTENSFNQLQESSSDHKPWPWRANSVTVLGGRDIGTDEYELGATKPETPTNRIRAETTVVWTVSERVDWRDDLF